jgi:GT2 family glycosyltransferase
MKSGEEKLINLAVLLTCFNRCQRTLGCLDALSHQSFESEVNIQIYLVDDGSTDGTSDAVEENFPNVNLIQGSGQLFWTGGMHLAFSEASQQHHDYYLWLNDDTELYPTALQTLLDTFEQVTEKKNGLAIVVGSTQDSKSGKLTYGGVMKGSWLHPCRFNWVTPTQKPQACDTLNGNCVLLPHQVVTLVGKLDTNFRHYIADFDYGLRAKKKGCAVWAAPGYVGTCEYNDPKLHSQTSKSDFENQLQKLEHPKGLTIEGVILLPFWEWKEFTKRHAGLLWLVHWLLPYRSILFRILLQKVFKKTIAI